MQRDTRLAMSEEAFRSLAEEETSDEFRFYAIWEPLIVENPDLQEVDRTVAPGAFTRGQLLLARMGTFHSQVNNGGIEQFFWNCPDEIFDVHDDFELLASQPILRAYGQALGVLVGHEEDWSTLKARWQAQKEPDFAAFLESRTLLDLEWFNADFFGKWEGGVQVKRGHGDEIARLTYEYAKGHPGEFITL